MGINFSKALSAYERADEVTIDCGGWSVRLRSFSSLTTLIRKKLAQNQSKLKASSVKKNSKALPSAEKSGLVADIDIDAAENFLFGSEQEDVKFFCEHAIVNWMGLVDDDDNEITYTVETGVALFTEHGEGGKRLYRELIAASMDDSLFMFTKDSVESADEKN